MPKKALPVHIVGMFLCGFVLQSAYAYAGQAAWSLLISSVNNSPWEMTKPFLWVYIFWSFIELSCHRPHLLHYVCARILSLHLFGWLSWILLSCLQPLALNEPLLLGVLLVSMVIAECCLWHWYRSHCRFELFFVPLLLSFILLFFSLLFCTLYPLPVPLLFTVSHTGGNPLL